MATVYVKTAAGQREIRERAHSVPRCVRTLLLLIDGKLSSEQLLQMVRGAAEPDFATLCGLALIEPQARDAATATSAPTSAGLPAAAVHAAGAGAGGTSAAASAASATMDYMQAYQRLNVLVNQHLGLMKAYRYSLDIEKADGVRGLVEVASRLADEVGRTKDPRAAAEIRREFGLAS